MNSSRISFVFLSVALVTFGITKHYRHPPAQAARGIIASQQQKEVESRSEGLPSLSQKSLPFPQASPVAPPVAPQAAAAPDEEEMIVVSEPAQSSSRSEIDNEILEAAMEAVQPELNRCYREALSRDKNLRGDITIEMTVAPQEGTEQGVIEDAAVDTEEFQAPLLEQCLLSAMVSLRLPKPSSRLYISYPFTLVPDDNDEKLPNWSTANR